MGARIALEALLYNKAPFLSLTCISTTLEILDRKNRIKQENEWIEKLSSCSIEEFILYWYSQPIFNGFIPPKRRYKQNKQDLIKVLKDYSSLNSPPFLEKIAGSKTPIHFLYKENDPKAKGYDPPLKNTHFIQGKSHPIHLENPSGYKKALLSIHPQFFWLYKTLSFFLTLKLAYCSAKLEYFSTILCINFLLFLSL
jgi:hypothetical protein